MPKKKKTVNPTASPLRFHHNHAPQSESSADISKISAFRFLDLHAELRMMIYDFFDAVPADEQDGDNERENIAKTRLSLLSVCKQVAEEWVPSFYQKKRFLVNIKMPGCHPIWKSHVPWESHDASGYFGENFLRCLSPIKLQNIRKIEYDLNWTQNSLQGAGRMEQPRINDTEPDIVGSQSLSKVLYDNRTFMQSLEEVTISAHYWCCVRREEFSGIATDNYLARWWSLATTKDNSSYNRMDFEKSFEALRRLFQSRNRHGVLRNWEVEKEIWISLCPFPQHSILRLRRGQEVADLFVRKVAMVFRRSAAKESPSSDGQAGCNVSLHACGPLIGY